MDPQDDFCAVNDSVCVVFKRLRLKILDSILLDPQLFIELVLSTLVLDRPLALELHKIRLIVINAKLFISKLRFLLGTIVFPNDIINY
jgi:hypothetical protein